MVESQKPRGFQRSIVSVDDQPRIYITPLTAELAPAEEKPPSQDPRSEHAEHGQSFFGDRIETLLFSRPEEQKVEEQARPLPSLEKALEAGLQTVEKKLERSHQAQRLRQSVLATEKAKHERFIQERNQAQETLFSEVIRLHSRFGTGLDEKALWTLHDFMVKLCKHEIFCSSEDALHQHLESNVLHFLRRKALETAWDRIEEVMERFNMPFPISSTVGGRDPAHNEQIAREARRTAKETFMKLAPDQLAELVLGNVPVWVYAYPAQESYLWRLTALQSVAAGIAADFFMQALALWEKESPGILKGIEHEFLQRVDTLRRKGESATDLREIHEISVALRRISTEEIPEHIWKSLKPHLEKALSASEG